MANEPEPRGTGAEGPEPEPPEPERASPSESLNPALDPAAPARARDSSNPDYDFELDLGLEVEPVDAQANTWGQSEAAGMGASTMGGMPGFEGDLDSQPLPEIPGYDILCKLARGGMGVVYLARGRELNRLCALKMILSGVHAGPNAIRRFLTEAGTAARLKHPGIVQVYRLGQHEGRPFLELEFLDGGALTARMDGTPWEPRRAATLMLPVTEAIAEAHRQGVVHRDIKPGNILLDADDRPKVSDFGLARVVHFASDLTESGQILGSPWYMAPEQASGHTREVRPPADVHALGAVLYELLTGRPPFKAASALSTLELVKSAAPVSPRRLIPTVPKDLETIILHCLEKNPDARYPNAGALAEDLSRFLRGDSVCARPIGLLVRSGRWCRRNPMVAGMEAALGGLLLVSTVIVWPLYLRGSLRDKQERFLNARLQQQIEATQMALEDSRDKDKALRATLLALERTVYAGRVNLAEAAYEAGDLARFHRLLDLLAPRPDATVRRGWEYGYLRRIGQGARPTVLEPQGEIAEIAFSPDGRTIAEVQRDGRVRLRDA